MTTDWWPGTIGYEVYPRSFLDSSGDGVGDIEGIRQKLDYLAWLGIDAVWITPFYASPGFDHGYDVADYTAINPIHGTLEDFDRLVEDAHAKNLRVIIDLVPNHSSSHHRWFQEALKGKDNPYRDYYIWRDPAADGGPPNNWVSHFGGPAWTLDEASGQYYCHLFLKEQPDLNWENEAVRTEFDDILTFWCERGVDGFRIDVAHALIKDEHFRDNPQLSEATPGMGPLEEFGLFEHRYDLDQNRNIEVYRRWNAVVKPYGTMLLGELGAAEPVRMARYHEAGHAIHRNFYIGPVWFPWSPMHLRDSIRGMQLGSPDSLAWVVDNHDGDRSVTRFGGGDIGRHRSLCLMTLMCGLGGMPFLWEGQELGLENGYVAPEDRTDPISTRNDADGAGGRDGTRTVMPWDSTQHNGFTTADEAWLRSTDRTQEFTVAHQKDQPDSWLHRHRDLIATRKALPDLVNQPGVWIDGPHNLTMTVQHGDAIVIANLDEYASTTPLPHGPWEVAFSSRTDGAAIDGDEITLAVETAAILRRVN